jgi:hypothetical protein
MTATMTTSTKTDRRVDGGAQHRPTRRRAGPMPVARGVWPLMLPALIVTGFLVILPVLVVTLAALAASSLVLIRVPEVGAIPRGLPDVGLALPWSDVPSLIVPALDNPVLAALGDAATITLDGRRLAHAWADGVRILGAPLVGAMMRRRKTRRAVAQPILL